MKRPWWKHVLTTLVFLLAPIWILPFMVVVLVALLWGMADHALWGRERGEQPSSGNYPGP